MLFVLLAAAPLAFAADEDELARKLTLELDDMLYERLAGPFSLVLKEQNLTGNQVDFRIRTASRKHAECAVEQVLSTARKEGIPEEEALRSVSAEYLFEQEAPPLIDLKPGVFGTRISLCGRFWLETLDGVSDLSRFASAPIARIEIAGVTVSLQSPVDFKPVSQNTIASASGGSRIRVEVKNKDISRVDIHKLGASFKRTYDKKIPAVEWLREDVWVNDGQEWVFLEFESKPFDVHKFFLATGFKGKLVLLHLESRVGEYPQYADAFRTSIETIELK